MKGKHLILIAGAFLTLLVIGSYSTWNRLDPVQTCAKCHEIAPSHESWMSSAHAEVRCTECHGTALSDGFSSLKEKTGMIAAHLSGRKKGEDIRLNEEQVLRISERCFQCHQSEYAGWLSGGHSINYREVFMNREHNAMEKPYWDCFRCHGMFYDGNIHDLMNLDGDHTSWFIRDKRQEARSAVPCLACHQIHTENPVLSKSDSSGRSLQRNPRTSLFVRADKGYLRTDMLTPVVMKDGDRIVNRAIDHNTVLCQQCHAPDYTHRAGSQDDRTPVGVHEGISCTVCHKPHSNSARESCTLCHSEVSKNCGMDVRKTNTTFLSPKSGNDIHRLSCVSCHEEK